MDLSNLNKKIIDLDKELQEEREYQKKLEIMEIYSGEDKVISSKELQEEIASQPNKKSFLTKIPKLDEIIGGFREGQLIVLSGPTGCGKTMFLQDLTRRFTENDLKCLWFSYEVGPAEFFERFNLDAPLFWLPRKIKESNLDWLEKRILEGVAKFDTKVVFIDHLHFLLNMKDLAQAKSTSLLIGIMMRELKKIALQTNTIIFVVSHIRKPLEIKPTLEDIRDSSFTAAESDLVMLIWRHKIKDKKDPMKYITTNETRISVEKNRRTGQLGFVKLSFNQGHYEELIEENYE